MNAKMQRSIAKKMGYTELTMTQLHDFLSKLERLSPIELNEIAMELLTRSVINIEERYEEKT
jgi:uncharacterized protein YfkK (UPF0435 family)